MEDLSLFKLLSESTDTRRIIITSHVNSDGDSLGSLLGLYWLIRDNFPERVVEMVINDDEFDRFAFLPGVDQINCDLGEDQDFILICVDAADLSRLGTRPAKLVPLASYVVNIDHHISNSQFGNLNIVELSSSTAELLGLIIAEWFESGRIRTVSHNCRLCLLTGIVSDTGSFRYPLTTPKTLRLSAWLSEGCDGSGEVSLAQVSRALFSSKRVAELRLKGDAFSRIEFLSDRVAFVVVDVEDFAKHGARYEDCDGLVESIRDIEGVEIAIVARFDGEKWRVSLRGKNDDDDLSSFAGRFGGGGHKMAAAFSWHGEISLLQKRIKEILGS